MAVSKKTKRAPFNKLKIGYGDFKVNHLTDKDASRRLIDGEYHSKEQEIDYDSSMNEQAQVNALFHEVAHAVLDVFGSGYRLKEESDEEEKFVRSFVGGILTVFRDNKEFYEWIGSVLYSEDEE